MQNADAIRSALTFALLAATLTGQKTWIVDDSGPADFTDLPAAFAKVADGDRVLVRPGSYSPATLDKAIQLVADNGAWVERPATSPFRITGIGAGKTCFIRGLWFRANPFSYLDVSDNPGTVTLAEVWSGLHLQVAKSKGVYLSNTTVDTTTSIIDSELVATASNFRGTHSMHGIGASASLVDLVQCACHGGPDKGYVVDPVGVYALSSRIVIRGDSTSRISSLYTNSRGAVDGHGSTLLLDPRVVVSPAPSSSIVTVTRRLPLLLGTQALLGSHFGLEIRSQARDPYAIAAALPTAPYDLGPFGRSWLEPRSHVVLVYGSQGSTESTTFSTKVPNDASLRGLALVFQALSVGSGSGILTNPVVPVVH